MDISSDEEGEVPEDNDEPTNRGRDLNVTEPSKKRRNTSSPSPKRDTISSNPPVSRKRNTSNPSIPDFEPTKAEALLDNNAEIAAAKLRLLSQIGLSGGDDVTPPQKTEVNCEVKEEMPNENTKATIDMILLIVGEVYGQRDLLVNRETWE
jgi:hypothetical protein